MNTAAISQEKKDRLSGMEKQMRLTGQKLDLLWTEARTAVGQARTDIHKLIGPLRKKLSTDREEHEALKRS